MSSNSKYLALLTRMQAAAVIARNKGRIDLVIACNEKIRALKRLGGFNPSWVAGVEDIERDCINAVTMDEVRASYRAFTTSAAANPRSVGEAPANPSPAGASFPSKRKAA